MQALLSPSMGAAVSKGEEKKREKQHLCLLLWYPCGACIRLSLPWSWRTAERKREKVEQILTERTSFTIFHPSWLEWQLIRGTHFRTSFDFWAFKPSYTFSTSIFAFIHPWLISPHHSNQMSQRSQVFNFSRRATRDADRMEIQKCDGPTYLPTYLHLTWVGAGDDWSSKNVTLTTCWISYAANKFKHPVFSSPYLILVAGIISRTCVKFLRGICPQWTRKELNFETTCVANECKISRP